MTLFIGLLVGSLGFDLLKRYAPGFAGNASSPTRSRSLVSLLAIFLFLLVGLLPADERRAVVPRRAAGRARRAVAAGGQLPGASALPAPLRQRVALKAFGGPALLLVWLYVMANVIVFGAEINCGWRGAPSRSRSRPEESPDLA